MQTQTISTERRVLPGDHLKARLSEVVKFRTTCYSYLATIVVLFILAMKVPILRDYNLKPGLVIGSLFPIMTLQYYYRHYLGGPVSNSRTIASWLLPSIFIQIITMFGFMITLSAPAHYGYQSQMFTGFYEYGKVFKSYNNVEKEHLTDFDKYKVISTELKTKMQQVMDFYLPFFDKDKLFKSDAGLRAAPEDK